MRIQPTYSICIRPMLACFDFRHERNGRPQHVSHASRIARVWRAHQLGTSHSNRQQLLSASKNTKMRISTFQHETHKTDADMAEPPGNRCVITHDLSPAPTSLWAPPHPPFHTLPATLPPSLPLSTKLRESSKEHRRDRLPTPGLGAGAGTEASTRSAVAARGGRHPGGPLLLDRRGFGRRRYLGAAVEHGRGRGRTGVCVCVCVCDVL